MTKCGWASIDEKGHASYGKAGDQTGREVKAGNWYQFGQTAVYRWKNRNYAEKYAKIIKSFCANKNIGYDQNQRTTLGYWCKHHHWSYEVNTPVETDCSRMVADAINCTIKREVIPLNSTFYTGNLGEVLMRTDLFTKHTGDKYTDSPDLLMTGDIILNEVSHVIMALENGAGVKKTGSTATSSGSSVTKNRIKKGQQGLNDLVGAKLAIDGSRGPATKKVGVMAIQTGLNRDFRAGLQVDGSYGPATKGAVSQHPALYGMSGSYIRAIQCLLYVSGYDPKGIDGHFGPGMKAAVGAFQRDKGLSVDYSVGPKTMLRLVS